MRQFDPSCNMPPSANDVAMAPCASGLPRRGERKERAGDSLCKKMYRLNVEEVWLFDAGRQDKPPKSNIYVLLQAKLPENTRQY